MREILRTESDLEVVGEAGDGAAGVEGVVRSQADVMLLDLSMPDVDGLEALEMVKDQAPRTRVVVLSGLSAAVAGATAMARGAHGYLEKGLPFTEIIGAVRAAGHANLRRPSD